jgi:hypothetical protein
VETIKGSAYGNGIRKNLNSHTGSNLCQTAPIVMPGEKDNTLSAIWKIAQPQGVPCDQRGLGMLPQ